MNPEPMRSPAGWRGHVRLTECSQFSRTTNGGSRCSQYEDAETLNRRDQTTPHANLPRQERVPHGPALYIATVRAASFSAVLERPSGHKHASRDHDFLHIQPSSLNELQRHAEPIFLNMAKARRMGGRKGSRTSLDVSSYVSIV